VNLAVQAELPLELRVAVQDFLWHEAELLDDRRFEDWLALFSEDIRYTAPISVTRKTPNPTVIDDIGYFDDNLPSLTLRVKRLLTDVAWAEDPPSHTRRFVTNIRVRPTEAEEELAVRSSLLLYRSRGDLGAFDLIVGDRQDLLRAIDGELRIARRRVVLDQSSLSTKNLGVFL
jgi:3-phenylpropionate/cinnamic acid dioxygenase small subunit